MSNSNPKISIGCPNCKGSLYVPAEFCLYCKSPLPEIIKSELREIKARNESKQITHERIGGWLIPVGIGIVLTPFRLIRDLLETNLFSRGAEWEALTTPEAEAYYPWLEPFLNFLMLGQILLLIFSFILVIYFSRKKRLFPRLFIIALIADLIFSLAIYGFFVYLISTFQSDTSLIEATGELKWVTLRCLIWIPYFRKSKRVKGTFIK
jgi:hypothetical protein